jgi:hypothetical protein
MKMKLAILLFEHSAGTDVLVHPVPEDWTPDQAIAYARSELEEQYGKEDIAYMLQHHGDIEHRLFLDGKGYCAFNHADGLSEKFSVQLVPR